MDNANDTLLYFVFGFGDGNYVETLLKQTAAVVKMVVYEPDTAGFMETYDEERLSVMLSDGRLTLVLQDPDNQEELEQVIDGIIQPYNAGHIRSLMLPQYGEHYKEEYEAVNDMLRRVSNERMNGSAGMRFHAELPCKNELYALSVLSENSGYNKLFERLSDRDMPVIIVAAGPSLDKNVNELSRAYKKALIVAASRTALMLDNRSIRVDLIAHIEPQSDGFLVHDGQKNHRVLISSRGDMEIQKQYRGRCIYFDFSEDLCDCEAFLSEMPEIEEHGGSVATYTCALFLKYGFKHIILIGQDLAFGEENKKYAGGDDRNTKSDKVEALVPGINGGMVETRHDWLSFIQCYESLIKMYPGAEVIDATEGGALINGSVIMSLSDAIDRYCVKEHDIDRILEDLPTLQSKDEAICLKNEMKYIAGGLSQIKEKICTFIEIGKKILADRNRVSVSDMKKYNRLYHEILESKEGNILIYYCEDLMQDYINNAVCFEASGDESLKIRTEIKTFSGLLEKIPELTKYMNAIYA